MEKWEGTKSTGGNKNVSLKYGEGCVLEFNVLMHLFHTFFLFLLFSAVAKLQLAPFFTVCLEAVVKS